VIRRVANRNRQTLLLRVVGASAAPPEGEAAPGGHVSRARGPRPVRRSWLRLGAGRDHGRRFPDRSGTGAPGSSPRAARLRRRHPYSCSWAERQERPRRGVGCPGAIGRACRSSARERHARPQKSVGSTCATCSARARHGLTLALTGPGVPFFGSLSRIAGRVDGLTD
jgi:hypothetical protein